MNTIQQRVQALRQEMIRRKLDAWYISGTDPHAGEYLPERWKIREFITGFTGSYGQVVITRNEGILWTDSRYFIQAQEQLQGTGLVMQKLRVPGAVLPEQWMAEQLPPGSRVGCDIQTLSVIAFRNMSDRLKDAGIAVVNAPDPFEKIWPGRPGNPRQTVFELKKAYTGLSREEKFTLLEEALDLQKADCMVISSLDEMAWLFNLRGSDIPYNPVFTGYAIVSRQKRILFVDEAKIPADVRLALEKDRVEMKSYASFFPYLKNMQGKKAWIDPSTASFAMYDSLNGKNQITEKPSPVALFKAQKNTTELEGFRQAMKKDGAALVEFMAWLRKHVRDGSVNEYLAGQKLAEFRSRQDDFRGESFAPIFGYQEHGAIVHYSADPGNALTLKPEGVLLFDSGGHYLQGTTDITRTIALGEVTPQQKTDYTLVLKGMIALTRAKFPKGTRGCNLDILARQALWENGLNYGHGTGHGVGHFLCVHEGPASIRQEFNEVPLMPGMVISNEPGIYRQGAYGIRIENLILCVEKENTPFGEFLGFETLTLCPLDTGLTDPALLTPAEKEWINNYHARVRKELSPLLSKEHVPFLNELTKKTG